MKKIITLILILTAIQSYGQKKISFGMRVGYGYSNVLSKTLFSNYQYEKITFKPTIQIGISGEYKIPGETKTLKKLFLQAEILYTNGGYRSTVDLSYLNNSPDPHYISATTIYKSVVNYNYIQLPIQLKIKSEKKVKLYYMIGLAPSIFFLESVSDNSVKHTYKPDTKYQNIVTANLLNTFGLEFGKGKVNPFIDFRYTQGLSNIYKSQGGTNLNIQFILSTGVKF